MSSHHGHHRSSHRAQSRSRNHHSSHYQSMSNRSRSSSSNLTNGGGGGGGGGGGSSSNRSQQAQLQSSHLSDNRDYGSGWSEHRSSSGKVYYYNAKTGVSQWEIPAELKKQRQPSPPDSEMSESSSIRQQQDKSPSSSASSHNSGQSESALDDKPLLTPSLAQYFKPELISDFSSSHTDELERRASQCSKDSIELCEKILQESVDLKIAKAVVHYVDISLEAQEKKYALLREISTNSRDFQDL